MAEVGRPLKFKTVKELQKKIDDYFASCFEEQWIDETRRDNFGNWILENGKRKEFHIIKNIQVEDFTITGLAIFLNTSRETLLDYQNRDEFSDTIKKAKLIVENSYEKRLINRGNSGDIFALKNFNWKDKNETDITSQGDKLGVIVLPQKNVNSLEADNQTGRSSS
jgi:hypothetical protein